MGNSVSIPPVPAVSSVFDYGDVQISNIAPYVARDLGWSGSIGYTIINTYGDTASATGTNYPGGRTNPTFPFAANSAATGTNSLLVVDQYFNTSNAQNSGNGGGNEPPMFCAYFPDEQKDFSTWGMGITAVQPVNNVLGVLYYLAIRRGQPGTPENHQYVVGAGIAKVDNSYTGYPVCQRLDHYDWDGQAEPGYGSSGSFSGNDPSTNNPYIYAIGGVANSTVNYVYITRVAQANALTLGDYEYWNGTGWNGNRLYYPGQTQALTKIDSSGNVTPFTDMGQASINWSSYYNAWIMMDVIAYATSSFSYATTLRVRTALNPQGPWGPETNVTTTGDYLSSNSTDAQNGYVQAPDFYAGCQQPWYDNSGKTLDFTYTYGASVQRALKITWK